MLSVTPGFLPFYHFLPYASIPITKTICCLLICVEICRYSIIPPRSKAWRWLPPNSLSVTHSESVMLAVLSMWFFELLTTISSSSTTRLALCPERESSVTSSVVGCAKLTRFWLFLKLRLWCYFQGTIFTEPPCNVFTQHCLQVAFYGYLLRHTFPECRVRNIYLAYGNPGKAPRWTTEGAVCVEVPQQGLCWIC